MQQIETGEHSPHERNRRSTELPQDTIRQATHAAVRVCRVRDDESETDESEARE
jgi:hypothetical protein